MGLTSKQSFMIDEAIESAAEYSSYTATLITHHNFSHLHHFILKSVYGCMTCVCGGIEVGDKYAFRV